MRTYTAQEVAQISGVSYRMVDYWARNGHLTAPTRGTGDPRWFAYSEAVKAVALANLTKNTGMTLPCAERILTDHHRKAKCVADFGAVRVVVDMAAIRKSVRAWGEVAA